MNSVREIFANRAIVAAAAIAWMLPTQSGAQDALLEAIESNIDIQSLATTYDPDTGVATAAGEVHIIYEDVEIFGGKAEYYRSTGDIFVSENVSIYKQGALYKGDAMVYNINTKKLTANEMKSSLDSILFDAGDFETNDQGDFESLDSYDALFTTHDSETPNWKIKARKVTIYPDDRIVFRNMKVYAGDTPVFYLPYLSQPFDQELGYTFTPGFESRWGAFLLNQYGVLWGDHSIVQYKFDLRTERGLAGGVTILSRRHLENENYGKFELYYANDLTPRALSFGDGDRLEEVPTSRYRVNLQHRIWLPGPEESNLYVDIDVNKLSDEFFYEDFFPTEFRTNPRPDNFVSLVKWDDSYEASLSVHFQLNDFFQTETRLPELAFDFVRQPVFGTGLFYEGEISFAILKEELGTSAAASRLADVENYQAQILAIEQAQAAQAEELILVQEELAIDPLANPMDEVLALAGSAGVVTLNDDEATQISVEEARTLIDELNRELEPFGYTRFHTYHQLAYPKKYFGWLNLEPRAGIGYTYYSDVTGSEDIGNTDRFIGHIGVSGSTKFSRVYDTQWTGLGVDEMRHIVQPYFNYSAVFADEFGEGFKPVDRFAPTTRLRPIDVPQFTATDEIKEWNILRLGMNNRWQTKRDGYTHNWIELNTFTDVFLTDPEFDRSISNLHNEIRWKPLPWLTLEMDTQVPLGSDIDNFYEFNSRLYFQPYKSLEFTIGHRYLQDHPFFDDSSLLDFTLYTQLNDNWGFSMYTRYEIEDSTFEYQRFSVHRDLASWTASLGAIVRASAVGDDEYGLVFTLTLKDFPQVSIPVDLNPTGQTGADGG